MDDVLATLPSHLRLLNKVQVDGLWTPLHVMEEAMDRDGLISHLNLVLSFGSEPGEEGYETTAANFIRLGRYGLHPVIEFLYQVYRKAMVSRSLTAAQLQVLYSYIDAVAIPTHMHILAFRTSHPRDLYDPAPVGFLYRMLEVHRHKFSVRVGPRVFIGC